MGINVDRIIVVAFALGAVLAAIAGISQGFQNNNIDFRMGFLAGLKAFTAAVLGIGNVYGAVVGGLVLGVVEALATQYIPSQFGGGSWKDVWAFVILILVLVFRPQGLLERGWWIGHERGRDKHSGGTGRGCSAADEADRVAAGIAAAVLVIVGSFLSWSYDPSILNDLSINLYPGGLADPRDHRPARAGPAARRAGPLTALGSWLDATLDLRALGLGLTVYMVLVIVAITVESDGLINVNPGAYVSLAGAVLILVSARMLPLRQLRDLSQARLPGWWRSSPSP